jgi:hypothetical protein
MGMAKLTGLLQAVALIVFGLAMVLILLRLQ